MGVQSSGAYVSGAQSTWKDSGGTYAITCTTLAAAASRQGAKSGTLVLAPTGLSTAVMPDLLEFMFQVQMTSAPTAGKEVNLYLGFSNSGTAGTNNPAGLSGTDAAGPNADTLPQLVLAGSIILSNNIATGVQLQYMVVKPLDAYVIPVVYNNADVSFDGTASHTVITMTPWYRVSSN